MHFTRSSLPGGIRYSDTAFDNATRNSTSMARWHGIHPWPPAKPESSNLLTRGLLARLHGVDMGSKGRAVQSLPPLRPFTTAVQPPMIEDGQPPSLRSRERSILGPRPVSDPREPTPLPSIEQQRNEMAAQQKREEDVMVRVDDALEETLRTKEKQRSDFLAGVPRHFSFSLSKCLVIYEDDLHRFRRKRRKANREARLVEKQKAASGGKPRVISRRHSPCRATFPKVADFISRENTMVDMNNAVLEWKLPTKGYHPAQPACQRQTACSVSGGKLCRSFYPVTEALHREGTSVSKVKGRSLGAGDCLVAKVWPRNLEKFATPLEMATEDRRYFYRGHSAIPRALTGEKLKPVMVDIEHAVYEQQQLDEQLVEQTRKVQSQLEYQQLVEAENEIQEESTLFNEPELRDATEYSDQLLSREQDMHEQQEHKQLCSNEQEQPKEDEARELLETEQYEEQVLQMVQEDQSVNDKEQHQ